VSAENVHIESANVQQKSNAN